jgi:hypothetical protein
MRTHETAPEQRTESGIATGWVAWIYFAAIMMLVVGMIHMLQGLVALFKDEYYVVGESGLLVEVDWTAWGWVHLLGGLLLILAGAGLFAGQMWARVVGVILAVVSIVINFAVFAAYPLWSTLIIAIDVLVIWALVVHGREPKYT